MEGDLGLWDIYARAGRVMQLLARTMKSEIEVRKRTGGGVRPAFGQKRDGEKLSEGASQSKKKSRVGIKGKKCNSCDIINARSRDREGPTGAHRKSHRQLKQTRSMKRRQERGGKKGHMLGETLWAKLGEAPKSIVLAQDSHTGVEMRKPRRSVTGRRPVGLAGGQCRDRERVVGETGAVRQTEDRARTEKRISKT